MFIRFRQTRDRLQVSLVENRRTGGKVRHEHIASFGSIATPFSVEARLAFWARLHQRLAQLANRVDAAKLLGSIHARVPMVTADEQRSLQLQNAEADERFWASVRDMNQATVDEHKGLAATVERKIANGEAAATAAAEKAAAAKDRVERIRRGEDVVGGLGKPLTAENFERIFREAGFTAGDIRFSEFVAAVSEDVFDEALKEGARHIDKRHQRDFKADVRAVLRRRDDE